MVKEVYEMLEWDTLFFNWQGMAYSYEVFLSYNLPSKGDWESINIHVI